MPTNLLGTAGTAGERKGKGFKIFSYGCVIKNGSVGWLNFMKPAVWV